MPQELPRYFQVALNLPASHRRDKLNIIRTNGQRTQDRLYAASKAAICLLCVDFSNLA